MTKITLSRREAHENDEEHKDSLTFDLESVKSIFKLEKSKKKVKDEPSVEKESSQGLDSLDRAAVVVALDECIQQLSIMRYLINEPVKEKWNLLFQYKTASERFSMTTLRQMQSFIEAEYENIPYTDTQKLQKDICFLITTIRETALEISRYGEYKTIENVVKAVRKQAAEAETLDEECKRQKQELKTLNHEYKKDKKDILAAIEKATKQLHILEDETDDVLACGKSEIHYVDDWESSRQYQQDFKLSQQEDVYNDVITKNAVKIEYENRIHNEIQTFIHENIDDLLNDINYWMVRYDEEVERYDTDIARIKSTWETLTEDHRVLANEYEIRAIFIIERKAINAERKRLADILAMQTNAATRIQAWWRGTMVRNKLGPFSDKKKKGKKGGKKGGKGKGGKPKGGKKK